MYVLYTDDSILAESRSKKINNITAQMCKVKLGITKEGILEDFIGANMYRKID